MREIKFRGKRADNGEWVYGDLMQFYNNGHRMNSVAICSTQVDEVFTNTVGQFTGLHDKNDKEIYEGDIVSFTAYKESKNWVRPIKWLGAGFTFGDIFPLNYPSSCYEIVGNIHDNPELLNE